MYTTEDHKQDQHFVSETSNFSWAMLNVVTHFFSGF